MSNNNSPRPASNPPGAGGNWPSTTGEKSVGNRGNAIPKSGKK